MSFVFKPAVRESVGLLIGLAGGTGSGKTYSGMLLASGIAGDKRFCVIDTEAGRAKHYADEFTFDHGDLSPPFTPERYVDAIEAADKAGYPVIIVDSMSHVWAGDGGVLDQQEAELTRMAGDDWKKRQACLMASWIKPKGGHKRMVARLLQVRANLILCFRAESKVEMTRDSSGKMQIVEKTGLTGLHGWFPVCEKNLPYELTVSLLLLADKPGVPQIIKVSKQQRHLFASDKPIDRSCGTALVDWASGGKPSAAPEKTGSSKAPPAPPKPVETAVAITAEQVNALNTAIVHKGRNRKKLCEHYKVDSLADLNQNQYTEAMDTLAKLKVPR